jgi:hypothetical protein
MAQKLSNAAVNPSYSQVSSGDSPARARLAPVVLALLRVWHHCKVWLVFFSLIHLTATPASAQVSKEYQLKAVFLWRLAQFTQWPADSFENADSPIIVCVLGENPFGDALDAAVRDETAHGRRLLARYYRGLDQVKMCHIVYIAGSVARQTKEIIAGVSGRSILTVSDIEGFTRSFNGMVRFLTEQNKLKLRVNLKAVTAAGLVLDPRLLRAAEIVGNE